MTPDIAYSSCFLTLYRHGPLWMSYRSLQTTKFSKNVFYKPQSFQGKALGQKQEHNVQVFSKIKKKVSAQKSYIFHEIRAFSEKKKSSRKKIAYFNFCEIQEFSRTESLRVILLIFREISGVLQQTKKV